MPTSPVSDAIYFNDLAQVRIQQLKTIREGYMQSYTLTYEDAYTVMHALSQIEASTILTGESLERMTSAKKPLWKRILRK